MVLTVKQNLPSTPTIQILNEGYPMDWTFLQSLVPIVGVVSQKKINRSHELKI
jgi:hypothetical protein